MAIAEPMEWPATMTLAKRGFRVLMTWWTALAWVEAVTRALSGLELLPVPRRSRARVAMPAAFCERV
jgi:hypothetical protein